MNQLYNQHVPDWFGPSVVFLAASHSSSTASVGAGPLNFCESNDFVSTHDCLFQVNVDSLSVYTDGSLRNLGTVDCKAGAAVFFENINLGVSVGVQNLVSSTLVELQAIALALECMPVAHSVNLFSDSQAALDAWNDHVDSIADAASLSGWYLSPCMDGHFLLVNGGVVSDVCHIVCHVHWEVGSGSGFLVSSLHSDVDWLSSSKVWHPDLHMATGFTSRLTANTHTYLIKTLHCQLPVAVQRRIYNKCYSNVLCLYCGKVEVLEFCMSSWRLLSGLSLPFSVVLQLMSTCVLDLLVSLALYKGFETVIVFHDPKIAGVKITDFVHSICSTFRNNIWLVCAKYRAFMEKNGLISVDGLFVIPVSGLVSKFSAGVVKLLGVTEAFGILFGFHKSCLFFSGIGDLVSVNIVV
ncbi:hypothetical protein G9A89_018752 [Geosiphon pyriformis]|nr:hypothetical protein G9A89_018752 [Geosiphon pyriformis]